MNEQNRIENLITSAMTQQAAIAKHTANYSISPAFNESQDLFNTLSDLKTELFKIGVISEEYFLDNLAK